MDKIKEGDVFVVEYPFIRVNISLMTEDGFYETESWKPGTNEEFVYPDDSEAVADGIGKMILSVVDVHKPGKFPERVFFTRKWVDPDGKEFGKNLLKIMVTPAFKRRASGFMYEYRLTEQTQGQKQIR